MKTIKDFLTKKLSLGNKNPCHMTIVCDIKPLHNTKRS